MKVEYPLKYPADLPRTRLDDRDKRGAWKRTERQAIEALEDELERFHAVGIVLTRQDPDDRLRARDPSVAVYFARRVDEEFSWQDALGIDNPAPSVEEINAAFKRLAAKYHPDNQATGDIETYRLLDQHKRNALAYVNQAAGRAPSYCLACDKFAEARWNIQAITNTVRSLRQMERDGTSRLVERALEGFKAQLAEHASESAHV